MDGSDEQAPEWKGPMNTVLDEVTSETVDAAHIRRRVEDWEERLSGLFAMIGEWLPEGWEARQGAPVVMHEELMRKFGVAAKRMPTLEIHGRMGHVARLEPRALWIIGGNGRVDLKHDGQRYLIVDLAENFEAPDWKVASAGHRCEREAFTRDWLRRVVL